jgi:cytochrome c peroxidase
MIPTKASIAVGVVASSLALLALAQTSTRAPVAPPAGPPALATLGPPPIPSDNPQTPAKVELGKKLFWDPRLSGNGAMACVTCHLPNLGWGDGIAISRGYPGTRHWRNSQTILNSAYYHKLFWDGAVTSLEAQAAAAAEGTIAGNGDAATMEMRLRFLPEYVALFNRVFGTQWPRINDAWRAISAYQRTIVTDPRQVPFDRWLAGDRNALNVQQLRGMALFNGKAACIQCHNGQLASDQRFHRLGVPVPAAFKEDPLIQITHRWQQYQRGIPEIRYRDAPIDAGLYYVTHNPKDVGKFRTPSLRELKYTAPYMHNGVFATLEEVVDFYNVGGGPVAGKSPLLRPLNLNAQERTDLVAFLLALSMDRPLIHEAPRLPGDYRPLGSK